MSINNFKNTVQEFNKKYKKKSVVSSTVKDLSEKNEKHINNTCNSLNYKYMKLQKKYKNFKEQDKSNLVSEDDIHKFLNI